MLLIFILTFSVYSKHVLVSKSDNKRFVESINVFQLYEDTCSYILVEEKDPASKFFTDDTTMLVTSKVEKEKIKYLVYYEDTVRFVGNCISRIDRNVKLGNKPKDGGYLSITELYYNQPSYSIEDIAVEYERKAHNVLRKRAKRHSKSLEKIAYLVGKSKHLPVRGVCKNGEMYWGQNREMFVLHVSSNYSYYERKFVVDEQIGATSWNGVSFNGGGLPRDMEKQLIVIDMNKRSEHILTKRYLKRILEKHDPTLLKQFKSQRNKDEHLKEYLLKLLEKMKESA